MAAGTRKIVSVAVSGFREKPGVGSYNMRKNQAFGKLINGRTSRITALDEKYREVGGMKGRYWQLIKEGVLQQTIAEEFGMSRHTLSTYWVPKWKREERGSE